MKPNLARACGALDDIDRLTRYAASIARVGAHLVTDLEPGDFAGGDVPYRASLSDFGRLFELIHILNADIQSIAESSGFTSPDDFAAHAAFRPVDFTAVAAMAVRPDAFKAAAPGAKAP